jgi:HK97 family phage portal protein
VLLADDAPPGVEERASYSIGDPALAEFLGLQGSTLAGVTVNESAAVGLTAVYRAVSIISGTIAGLPLRSLRTSGDGARERVETWLDNPAGPGSDLTQFEWVETVMVHLLLHGNAYLLRVYNGAGAVVGLSPVPPSAVTVKPIQTAEELSNYGGPDGAFRKWFTVSLADGSQRDLTQAELEHIPALSTDGLRGLSPIEAHRQALGTAIAGDRAAARLFGSGLLLGGLVSGDDDLAQSDAEEAVAALKAKLAGSDHAGDIAFINARLKFTPWTIPPVDAQFIESRVHQIEEVARIYGVPPHLLGQTEKQTSWGTGVAEQNRGLARYTLMSWTTRLEQRLSRLLSRPTTAEFDYSGLLQPAPEVEIPLLLQQVDGGLLSLDEARRVRNMPPAPPAAVDTGGSLVDKVNAATALIRAGFDPVSALAACGLPAVTHLGLLPVTLQKEEQFDVEADAAAAALEGSDPVPA